MSDKPEEGVQTVAADIVRYLRRHPGAADTAEGIARWWLGGRHYEETLTRVEHAIGLLVQQGLVEKQLLPDGAAIYRSGPGIDATRESKPRES
jgi:hypothetical protein